MQSDPIGLDGGLNTHAHVENNLLNSVDPLGLYGLPWEAPPNWTPAPPVSNNDSAKCTKQCIISILNPIPDIFVEEGAGKVGQKIGGTTASKILQQGAKKINKVQGAIDLGRCMAECNKNKQQACK